MQIQEVLYPCALGRGNSDTQYFASELLSQLKNKERLMQLL